MQKRTRELRELWAKSAKQSDASRMAGEYTPCCLSEAKTRCSHERGLHFGHQRKRCGEPPTAYAERAAKAKGNWQASAKASEAPEKKYAKPSDMLGKLRRITAICRMTSPTKAIAMQSTCQWALPSKAKPKKGERGRDSRSKKQSMDYKAKLRKAMQRKSRHPLTAVASHEKCDSTAYSGACACISQGETHQEWHRNAHWHTPRTLLGIPPA